MYTQEIINGRITDETVLVSPYEIMNSGLWYSGDFDHQYYCECEETFHICSHNPSEDFWLVINSLKDDFYRPEYQKLFNEIKTTGFTYPLSGLMSQDYTKIGFVDGHHRLFISLELNLQEIPVHIFPPETAIVDITLWDSKVWS